jgi:hypothetical protein
MRNGKMADKEFFENIQDCIGLCEYCSYLTTDGDYGQYKSCDCKDIIDNLDCKLGTDILCPFWHGDIRRCKKHNKLMLNDCLCDDCYSEFLSDPGPF